MFRTVGDQPSSWESRLPAEVLRLPDELARVGGLLDDPAFFEPFRPCFHPVIGRPSTPVECCLRLMFLKFRCRLGCESLCAEVGDSISWRRFCRIPLDGKVPHPTTLMKLATRCGSAAVGGLNEALLAKAAGQGLLSVARVRADTTVVPANVACPADSGLPARAVGKLVRTARRARAAGGAAGAVMTDRRRAAARRVREIAGRLRTRGKLSREESTRVIARVTGELADLAEKAAAEAAAVLRNGRRALPRALSGRVRGRLRRALDELAVIIERTATVIAQARSRLAGQMPDSATRLVSLHDPDARPIRKGRTGRPAGFGYKAQVTDNDDGIIVDYAVEYGAAPDGPQLVRAVKRAARRAGQAPGAVTADRGHGQPASRRARPAGTRRPDRGHSPPGQDLTSPQGHRAQPRLPQAGQMAHRMRGPDQLPQALPRLGPHPPGRQNRSRHLVRIRGTRPQPAQDQRTGQPTTAKTSLTPPPHHRPNSALRLFQVEVASRRRLLVGGASRGGGPGHLRELGDARTNQRVPGLGWPMNRLSEWNIGFGAGI
jgi:IS5 family transposase